MLPVFVRTLRAIAGRMGYTVQRNSVYPDDLEASFRTICDRVRPFTMTSVQRMYGLYKAVEYVVGHRIPGDIVECGVWKGGSSMLAALTLKQFGDQTRRIFLYDTFAGMPEPGNRDVAVNGRDARDTWARRKRNGFNEWCLAPLDAVKENLLSTDYPAEKLIFAKGKVEETIPRVAPDTISILRLDTDWYESTYHELLHLFPRLAKGGVLLLDDYGFWKGSRDAVDRYLSEHQIPMLLSRLDTGRMGIKL